MRVLREWWHRLAGTVSPSRSDSDLDEEIRLHLDLAAEAAQRRGETSEEARRLARVDAGSVTAAVEALREQRGLIWLDDLARDCAYGFRTLWRAKAFTATALLSLALGIGAAAGIFTLLDQLLLRPLPVREPDRLVQLEWQWQGQMIGTSYGNGMLSHPLCRELATHRQVFDGVFCRYPAEVNLRLGATLDRVGVELVSGSYFEVLGVTPALGRMLQPSDDLEPDSHPVVVLSYDYWQTHHAAAPDVVGRSLLINNYPMTVVGVAPAGFHGVDLDRRPALWTPLMMKRQVTPGWDGLLSRRSYWLHVFGRLRPGMSPEQARAQLLPWFQATVEADMQREGFPALDERQRASFQASTLSLIPATRGVSSLRERLGQPLWVLMGGTLVLLLLAATNVAGLLLARGAARTRELATRMALGASRGRVTRQLLVETTILAAGGGLLGIAAAPLVARVLRSFIPEGANVTAGLDGRVLMFVAAASVGCAILCGLAPAFQLGRLGLSAAIADRSTLAAGAGARARRWLVAGQIALALILLNAAGLFVQTLYGLHAKGPGFATGEVLMFSVDPPQTGATYERSEQTMRELLRAIAGLPQIARAAIGNTQVLNGGTATGVYTIHDGARRVTDRPVHRMRVTPGFFSVLGVQLLAGRDFDARDSRPAGAPPGPYRTAIVNDTFARRYFGGRSPVGARIGAGGGPTTVTDIEIIGVVGELSRRDLRDSDIDQVFFNFWDNQSDNGAFYVKVQGDLAPAIAAVRSAAADVDPLLPVAALTTLDRQIGESLQTERALAVLSAGFGFVALIVAVIGLYGVMTFVAAQRTQEIGVRLALGAPRLNAAWVVLYDALVVIGAGTAMAFTASWFSRRMIEGELFGVSPLDGPTIATAAAGFATVGLGAAALPAWRAAILPPMSAIRDQPESIWAVARTAAVRVATDIVTPYLRTDSGTAALVGEFGELVQGSASFAEAIQVALTRVRERTGAHSVTLLERRGKDFCGDDCTLPAEGLLLNRLSHFPHPLPVTEGDLRAWRTWAGANSRHVAEIECLERLAVRLAVPLRIRSHIVGVLLLGTPIDRAQYSSEDIRLVGSTAEVLALMLENARLNDRAIEQEKLRRDVALAAAVQRGLLPERSPQSPSLALSAFTVAARSVGGDYYDFVELDDGGIGVAMADVSGKGIAAALLTSAVQALLRTAALERDITCAEIAARINHQLHRSAATGKYATFFYARFDADGKRLTYVNAGHNPPYLLRREISGLEILQLREGGTVLGLFPDATYAEASIELQPGDLIVLFTDGVPEAHNRAGEEFGEEALKALLHEVAPAGADEVASVLAARMRTWGDGAEQHDDMTVVVAKVQEL